MPVVILGITLAMGGCSKKVAKEAATEYRYHFRMSGTEGPAHAQVLFHDQPVGVLTMATPDTGISDDKRTHAMVVLPADVTVWQHPKDFSVQVMTPCGERRFPIRFAPPGALVDPPHTEWVWTEDYEKQRRADQASIRSGEVLVPIEIDGMPRFVHTRAWVDDHRDAAPPKQLQIGRLTLPGGSMIVIDDLACAPSHDIVVGGKPIGQLQIDGTKPAYLISSQPGFCYKLSSVYYAKDPSNSAPSTSLQLQGGKVVYPLDHDGAIEFFLREAPTMAQAGPVNELVRVPCT